MPESSQKPWRRRNVWGARAISLLLFLAFTARAGVVVLRDGRKLEGVVTQNETHVIVKRPSGSQSISKKEVLRIEDRKTPIEEYMEMSSRLSHDDAVGHVALGLWCKRRRLMVEARKEFTKALAVDEKNDIARQELASPSDASRRQWKHEWHRTTPHFLIYTNTTRTLRDELAENMEALYGALFALVHVPPRTRADRFAIDFAGAELVRVLKDGTPEYRLADGRKALFLPNGEKNAVDESGVRVRVLPNKPVLATFSNTKLLFGHYVASFPLDVCEAYEAALDVDVDLAKKKPDEKYKNGVARYVFDGGDQVVVFPGQGVEYRFADGHILRTYETGEKVLLLPDGREAALWRSGFKRVTYPNLDALHAAVVKQFATHRVKRGEGKVLYAINKQGYKPISDLPGGVKVLAGADGTIVFGKKGETQFRFKNGDRLFQYGKRGKMLQLADGTKITLWATDAKEVAQAGQKNEITFKPGPPRRERIKVLVFAKRDQLDQFIKDKDAQSRGNVFCVAPDRALVTWRQPSKRTQNALFREGSREILRTLVSRPPWWLKAGIGEYFGSGRARTLGMPHAPAAKGIAGFGLRNAQHERALKQALGEGTPLHVTDLLKGDIDLSSGKVSSSRAALYAACAWSWIYFASKDPEKTMLDRLGVYVRTLMKGGDAAAAFTAAYGKDFAPWEAKWRAFLGKL